MSGMCTEIALRGLTPIGGGSLSTKYSYELLKCEVQSWIGLIGSVGAESPGFMFPANMIVKSFDVEVAGVAPIPCTGNKLSADAKQALNRLRVGQKAYFDNIKVETPTKEIIKIPMAQIRVKG